MKGKLRFEENSGRIEFSYTEPIDDRSHHQIDGKIPPSIVQLGKTAIRAYAEKKVEQAQKGWQRAEKIEKDIRTNYIPIRTDYDDGTSLEGRIVEATSRLIRVELDSPVVGKGSINFGFASAMAGHYVFGKGHKISEHGYEAAYRALRSAYKDSLHKPTKDLVRQLNK